MDTRKTIINLLRSTGRKGIENVISLLENSNFFTVGSHSHHRYVGGTADHALETLMLARRHGRGIDDNSLIITSLLHDICNIHGYRDIDGHGGRSARILKDVCHLELTTDECNAIRYHMWKRHKRPVRSKLELAVFDADKSSAKRYCLQDLLSFTEIAIKIFLTMCHTLAHT